MIARGLLVIVLLAIAAGTAGLQLDRQSRYQPVYAAAVPEAFAAFALPHRVGAALNSGQPQLGLAQAELLVARRPMPALHMRLLSQAQFAAGDAQDAILTVQYAARRGWRDTAAQDAMLRLALSAGDKPEAARRYAALFIDRGANEEELALLAQDIFTGARGPEAIATFAEILTGAQRWHSIYLRKGPRTMPASAFAQITAQSAEAGVAFDCKLLRNAQKAIDKANDSAADNQASEQMAQIITAQC